MLTSKLLIISDGCFNEGRSVDATRFSFINEALKQNLQVQYLQASDFDFSDKEQLKYVKTEIEHFKPDLVIAWNASGLVDPILSIFEKNKIPVVSWYWDHPDIIPAELVQNSLRTHIFHACTGYEKSRILKNAGEWLPFSSDEADLEHKDFFVKEPPHEIVHLGTLWHIARVFQQASAGLFRGSTGEFVFGHELFQCIENSDLAEDFWLTASKQKIPHHALFNALAGLKRARTLSWFKDFDLHIKGGFDWALHLWPVAPDLLPNFSYANVVTHEQMGDLTRQYKINLNIFHPQNSNGGTNFRVLDCARHGVALLSDYNRDCEKLFPHEEAGFYFNNPSEAYQYAKILIDEPDTRNKLVKRAAEILNDYHTHAHRYKYFINKFGLKNSLNTSTSVEVVSNRLPQDIFNLDKPFERLQKNPNDVFQSEVFKTEKYFANIESKNNVKNILYTCLGKARKL